MRPEVRFGYHLSSEEHPPRLLVRNAVRAEEAGFQLALLSDHFHPWIDAQGESSFAWTVLGAIAQATEKLQVGTGVTCPTIRYHPALVAQMAATAGALFQGRFFLGLGTGEYLNEHIYGDHWPRLARRTEMLEEACGIIRALWEKGLESHEGRYFTVESARIYSLPEPLPPIYFAAQGVESAQRAAKLGDGLIGVGPDPSLVKTFRQAGGNGLPACAKVMLCWAEDEEEARQVAFRWWPLAGLDSKLLTELRLPSYFEAALRPLRPESLDGIVSLGPDVSTHVELIDRYVMAGFDHIVLHQVGPDQESFLGFWERELRPELVRRYSQASSTERSTA